MSPQDSAGNRPIVDPTDPETDPELVQDAGAAPDDEEEDDAAPAPPAQPMSPFREKVATVVAVLAIIGLAAFYIFMLRNLTLDADSWARVLSILAGAEGLVFGAAGFLFGTSIQRSRIQAAETRTTEEKKEARRARRKERLERRRAEAAAAGEAQAQQQAAKGKMLARQILAKSQAKRGAAASYGDLGHEGTKVATADLEELTGLAEMVLE